MTFNPVDHVLEGYGNEITDSQNGCSGWQIAADGAEGVLGLAALASIPLGVESVAGGGAEASISSIDDIMSDPHLLSGKTPSEVEQAIGNTPGWRAESLGKGSQAGNGWVLRQYTSGGNPTGLQVRWHPGGGHHGPEPYWRVVGPNGDLGGIIR